MTENKIQSDRKGYFITDQFATYFLTFTITGWVDIFTRKEIREKVLDSLKYCQAKKGLILYSFVIMSNHIHLIASAEENTPGLSSIIRDFKKFTSKEIIKWINKNNIQERRSSWMEIVFKHKARFNKNNKNYKIWQDSNHPKILLHPKFIAQKIEYIHNNPVKAGIVRKPEEYIYSSAGVYSGREDCMLDITIIDFGVQEGYIYS